MIFLGFRRLPSEVNFLPKLSSSFSKLDILKMSIFEKLTTSFVQTFSLRLKNIVLMFYTICYHKSFVKLKYIYC